MKNKNEKRKNGFKIPNFVNDFNKLEWDKFKRKKENKVYSKKERKELFYYKVLDLLPEMTVFILQYGHKPEVNEIRESSYNRFTDPEFVKMLYKDIKKNDMCFDNMEFFPTIIFDIIKRAQIQALQEAKNNPNGEKPEYDLDDLVKLSKIILKPQLKKAEKLGIPEDLAFDVLSVIPTTKILSKSPSYHIRELFNVIYKHAKDKDVDFEKVMKLLFKHLDSDESKYILIYSLLEKKEKYSTYTDTQKTLFNKITEYTFKTLESLDKNDISDVLEAYVTGRKNDEKRNQDSNRRYYISSLPESDYPKILKVVEKIISKDENNKKYF